MQHNTGFLKICEDARMRVQETDIHEIRRRQEQGHPLVLIDVREDHEWAKDHIPGAVHLGRGIIERDMETRYPDRDAEYVLYCGGGFRSALAADNLQRMGYTRVLSMDGGIRAWREANYPLSTDLL